MWPDDYRNPGMEPEHPEGELAAFALNALDDAEFQAVFHHVIQCLHCQEVLLGFQDTAARLTEAAAETPLPPGLKGRVLAGAVGQTAEPALPPMDPRWSLRGLRRWIAPVAIGALSLLLAASIGFMVSQQREINQLTDATEQIVTRQAVASAAPSGVGAPGVPSENTAPATAGRPAEVVDPPAHSAPSEAAAIPRAGVASNRSVADRGEKASTAAVPEPAVSDAEEVDLVKQEMDKVVESVVKSVQPETEKLPMKSPMGTEPAAQGVLMVDPSGRRAVLMVSGMPADTYQILLVRAGQQMPVGRIVVNEEDGSGVEELELNESVFGFHEVALMPDERHGPSNPTGEKFLSARIIAGPPAPPALPRGR